ncbi:MAG TPA: hypothetical protein VKU01_01490 [Bryobacteraceae bacterium]|nr:hypothetical protein [Bryobacteraceae bacterium]
MVGLILLFIFLTPRDWFRDQPKPNSVTMIPSAEKGASTFWMAPALLAGVPESERLTKSGVLLRTLRGKKYNVVRLEPIFDSEQEIQGYIAYTNP